MALLHYVNLGAPNPRRLLQSAYWGLRDFYEFLNHTIRHLEAEASVLRLAWKEVPLSREYQPPRNGHWVELREPDDRPNEPERTFDAFLDDDVREVFELDRVRGDAAAGRRISFKADYRIAVVDRDLNLNRLLLDRLPSSPELCLKPNTTTLKRQLDAVRQLQDAPSSAHWPLLQLFEPSRDACWPHPPDMAPLLDWLVLTDETRPGTLEQRAFVELGLRTPDFALLEGPPGSGKTTCICELVLQLVNRGLRVLLCASTHVAVDNVLERLGPLSQKDDSDLVPVRVGDRQKVADSVRRFQLERLVETERERILAFLEKRRPMSEAQQALFRAVSRRSSDESHETVERMILDAANLVCGTTTGILRHPDICNASATTRAGMFDVMILDEASKTTFQEFLVPALLAKKWIIVGDPCQLSPFIEEEAIASNLAAAFPDEATRNACVDVFSSISTEHSRRPTRASLVVADAQTIAKYQKQAEVRGVFLCHATDRDVGLGDIVVGDEAQIAQVRDALPADISTVRGIVPETTVRRARAYRHSIGIRDDAPPVWEKEVSWRLARHFELRQACDSISARNLMNEIDLLMPVGEQSERNLAAERIDRVRRVAFPSVLESLQKGFERNRNQRQGTALSDGLPAHVFASRHVLLEYQHRMHPEISTFPRERFYRGTALKDPPDMATRRQWTYPRYGNRAVWLDVTGRFERGCNRNTDEVDAVMAELERFRIWAATNPKLIVDGHHRWEVAVLTFYRGQERAMREQLRKLTRQPASYRNFEFRSGGRVDVSIELCTVDRFQGQEADLVFLSIATTRPTNFFESTNRMNVALTRARYQRVIVGDRKSLRGREGTLLHELISLQPWETRIGVTK